MNGKCWRLCPCTQSDAEKGLLPINKLRKAEADPDGGVVAVLPDGAQLDVEVVRAALLDERDPGRLGRRQLAPDRQLQLLKVQLQVLLPHRPLAGARLQSYRHAIWKKHEGKLLLEVHSRSSLRTARFPAAPAETQSQSENLTQNICSMSCRLGRRQLAPDGQLQLLIVQLQVLLVHRPLPRPRLQTRN